MDLLGVKLIKYCIFCCLKLAYLALFIIYKKITRPVDWRISSNETHIGLHVYEF